MVQIKNLVKPEYFESEIHQFIFTSVTSYYDSYQKLPNNDFLLEELKIHTSRDIDINDYAEEVEIIDTMDSDYVDNPEFYLNKVEQFAKKMALKDAIIESVDLLEKEEFGYIEETIRKALLVSRDVDCGHDYFNNFENRPEEVLDPSEKFPTPFKVVNDELGGGNSRKELCLVVAKSGVGKSLYLVNHGVKALMRNRKVLYVSMEMAEHKVAQRFDSVTFRLPINQITSPKNKYEILRRSKIFKEKFPGAQLVIKEYPTGQANVNTIRALLHNLRNYHKFVPDMVIVDYLELLRPVREIDAEYLAQQRIAEELRGLSMEYNCLVSTATQASREGAKAEIIDDTKLADSYGKIRTADFSISINQTDQEYDEGKARGYIMKARDAKGRYIFPITVDYETLIMEQGTNGIREKAAEVSGTA